MNRFFTFSWEIAYSPRNRRKKSGSQPTHLYLVFTNDKIGLKIESQSLTSCWLNRYLASVNFGEFLLWGLYICSRSNSDLLQYLFVDIIVV